jgi:hypothetical protein
MLRPDLKLRSEERILGQKVSYWRGRAVSFAVTEKGDTIGRTRSQWEERKQTPNVRTRDRFRRVKVLRRTLDVSLFDADEVELGGAIVLIEKEGRKEIVVNPKEKTESPCPSFPSNHHSLSISRAHLRLRHERVLDRGRNASSRS